MARPAPVCLLVEGPPCQRFTRRLLYSMSLRISLVIPVSTVSRLFM